MSIIVKADDPSLKPARYKDIQRQTPITASAYNGKPGRLVENIYFYLYLRLRYANGRLRVGYRALLSAMFEGPIRAILASLLALCAYLYIMREAYTSLLSVVLS